MQRPLTASQPAPASTRSPFPAYGAPTTPPPLLAAAPRACISTAGRGGAGDPGEPRGPGRPATRCVPAREGEPFFSRGPASAAASPSNGPLRPWPLAGAGRPVQAGGMPPETATRPGRRRRLFSARVGTASPAGLLLLLLGGCESLPRWPGSGAGAGQPREAEALRQLDGRQRWLEQQVRQLDERQRRLERRLEQRARQSGGRQRDLAGERRQPREERQALEEDRRRRREQQRQGVPPPPPPPSQPPEQEQVP
jgi:hypothetical protein